MNVTYFKSFGAFVRLYERAQKKEEPKAQVQLASMLLRLEWFHGRLRQIGAER